MPVFQKVKAESQVSLEANSQFHFQTLCLGVLAHVSSSTSQSSSNQAFQETTLQQQLIAQHQNAFSDISKYANNRAIDKGRSREGKEK